MYRSGQQGFGQMIPPAIKNLLIANGAIFVLMMLIPAIGDFFYRYFSLIPVRAIFNFEIWRVFSYMFLHGGFSHIFFNMFALWMFGASLERIWGSKEFYKYFFLTGVFAGFSSLLMNFGSGIPIVGASGAVYGILMACALLFPEQEIYLYFLLPIKMKYFAIGLGVIEFITAMGVNDGIAHFAHLGGMVAGYLYLRSKYGDRIPKITELFKKKHY